jgi:hypothetical protein
MPPVSSFGPESCHGVVRPGRQCLGTEHRATTNIPVKWDGDVPYDNTKPLMRAGHWLHYWEADPAWVQAKAVEFGVEVSDLLCRGCETRRQRLIGEGLWPA